MLTPTRSSMNSFARIFWRKGTDERQRGRETSTASKRSSARQGERCRALVYTQAFDTFRSDDAIIFNKAKVQLLESMNKFVRLVPGTKSSQVPTCWDDVAAAVAEAQSLWEAREKDSRVGRVKELLRKMCNGLNNHATVLKMLPTESEYVSLVAGSVSLIIKVAIHTQWMPPRQLAANKNTPRPPQTTSTSPNHLPGGCSRSMTPSASMT